MNFLKQQSTKTIKAYIMYHSLLVANISYMYKCISLISILQRCFTPKPPLRTPMLGNTVESNSKKKTIGVRVKKKTKLVALRDKKRKNAAKIVLAQSGLKFFFIFFIC